MQLDLNEDATKICRTCMQKFDKNVPFFNLDIPTSDIDPITIRYKLNVYMPEMDLPLIPLKEICNDCCTAIDSAYEFKKNCLEIESNIRKYLQSNNVTTFENLLRVFKDNEQAKSKSKVNDENNINIKEEPVDDYEDFNDHTIHEDPVETPPALSIKPEPNDSVAAAGSSDESFVKSPNVRAERKAKLDVQTKKKLQFKCELCGFMTSSNASFAAHMKIHSNQIFSNCSFANESKPPKYQAYTRIARTLYKCEMCNYASYKKTLLRMHIRKIHKPEKPYRCTKCMYSTTSNNCLDKHMKVHIIRCDICNYSSLQLSSIKAHLRTHTGEKPYECTKCNYRASQKGTLKNHMQTHNNECHLCGYRTKTDLRLLDHMVWHATKPNAQFKGGKSNVYDHKTTVDDNSVSDDKSACDNKSIYDKAKPFINENVSDETSNNDDRMGGEFMDDINGNFGELTIFKVENPCSGNIANAKATKVSDGVCDNRNVGINGSLPTCASTNVKLNDTEIIAITSKDLSGKQN